MGGGRNAVFWIGFDDEDFQKEKFADARALDSFAENALEAYAAARKFVRKFKKMTG